MTRETEEARDRRASEAEHEAALAAVRDLRRAANRLTAEGVYLGYAREIRMQADVLFLAAEARWRGERPEVC